MAKVPYPNRLAEWMAAAGLTDPALAELAGTSKQQIFKLRRGERKLTVEWAHRLAPHLGIGWQDLVEADPTTTPGRNELFAAFEALDDDGRRLLLEVARSLAATHPRPPPCVIDLKKARRG
ncbi:MAG: helix-turn-helix transcriptional regulator [Acetobacteraceae bacterium]